MLTEMVEVEVRESMFGVLGSELTSPSSCNCVYFILNLVC
jgi:hypothetical protein